MLVASICGIPLILLVVGVGETPRHYIAELALIVLVGTIGWYHGVIRLAERDRATAVLVALLGGLAIAIVGLSAVQRLTQPVIVAGIAGAALALVTLAVGLRWLRSHGRPALVGVLAATLAFVFGLGAVGVRAARLPGQADANETRATADTIAWLKATVPPGGTVAFGPYLSMETSIDIPAGYRAIQVRHFLAIADPSAALGLRGATGTPEDFVAVDVAPIKANQFNVYAASRMLEPAPERESPVLRLPDLPGRVHRSRSSRCSHRRTASPRSARPGRTSGRPTRSTSTPTRWIWPPCASRPTGSSSRPTRSSGWSIGLEREPARRCASRPATWSTGSSRPRTAPRLTFSPGWKRSRGAESMADHDDRAVRIRPACMIVHSYYEEDPRVRREAEALVARGRPVDVIALRRPGDGPTGTLNGVRIRRIDVQRHQGAGLWVYLREYLSFLVRASWAATRAHRRRRYGLVQVHSLPDFLVFAALPLKLVGVPVILDLHEAMPEFFRTRFPTVRSPRRPSGAAPPGAAVDRASPTECSAVNELMADRLLGLGVETRQADDRAELSRTSSLFDPASASAPGVP